MRTNPQNITHKVGYALNWIIPLLEKEHISYQILGGLAASFYGATRPINDIDIDIPEKDFPRLFEIAKPFVSFGPDIYIDSEWMVLMMILNYKGQIIEITNGDYEKIFDDLTLEWKTFRYDLADITFVNWQRKLLRLMKPEKMVAYKRYLHGEKQQQDIQIINNFIKSN